jgi:hypothetical protein
VPDEFLAPLVRGLLDGDATIANAIWRADTTRRSDYYYEWLRTRFISGSLRHLEWLKTRLHDHLDLRGWIWLDKSGANVVAHLNYGKHDSIKLLRWAYAESSDASLLRKRAIWTDYEARHPDWIRELPTTIDA